MKGFAAIAVSVGLLSAVFAETPLPEPTVRLLSIEYPVPGAEPGWIRSETDLVFIFPLPLEAVRAVLTDYASYPRFFPRLARTTVLSGAGTRSDIRQRYEISILGYRYPTEYDLSLEVDESRLPARWTMSWNLAGSDGTIAESRGSWTLEDAGAPGSPATRVTHSNRGMVKRSFPLQERIMRAVALRELSRSILSVYGEALARRRPDSRLALVR